ncbi:hypothetical protein LAC02_37500 [Ligilactobacillus acidipiscis]|nr:hypothetical protein LAC02_37500 [Ligilactobacillus acidipiscis]
MIFPNQFPPLKSYINYSSYGIIGTDFKLNLFGYQLLYSWVSLVLFNRDCDFDEI